MISIFDSRNKLLFKLEVAEADTPEIFVHPGPKLKIQTFHPEREEQAEEEEENSADDSEHVTELRPGRQYQVVKQKRSKSGYSL